jgi:8-oxo-dGTP pyrophosphatase MutT (NUDIX family)
MDMPIANLVPTRPASTVVLVRELERELQVYLLKRSAESGFFPGNYVFPGGTLNPHDGDWAFWQDYIDLSPEDLLKMFGSGLDLAGIVAYGVAAIRETFEEAGVLLARKRNDRDDASDKACQRGSARGPEEGWLGRKVLDEGWLLSFSRLFPWSHWITPEAMPKRFDTRFFIALMPEGQACIPDELEAVHGLWINPKKGLQGNMEGVIPLSPPTLVTLHEMLPFQTLDELVKGVRSGSWGNPRLPIFMKVPKGAVIVQPWDPQHGKKIEINPEKLEEQVRLPGEPFSRLWLNQGIWRPLGF